MSRMTSLYIYNLDCRIKILGLMMKPEITNSVYVEESPSILILQEPTIK
jgi:hypothetical protein